MSKKRRQRHSNSSSLLVPLFCIIIGCGVLMAFQMHHKKSETVDEKEVAVPESTDLQKRLEIPEYVVARSEERIEHFAYTVSYNPEWRIPNWVAYELTAQETQGTEPRAKHFEPDPDVKGVCPETRDYSNSDYDRGHMAPAGDMKWNEQAMRESFYMSNICPQNHNLNDGDWKFIEEKARSWATKFGKLYIVCGPIVSQNPQTIGYAKVAVPDAFFKVFLCKNDGKWQAIGFLCKNEAGHRRLSSYCKSVDEIESLTGIDFFPKLNDKVEAEIEADYELESWGIR